MFVLMVSGIQKNLLERKIQGNETAVYKIVCVRVPGEGGGRG